MVTRVEIEEMMKPLSEKYQNIFYVYQAFVDGELKYIGKGKGKRWEHCTSGSSSCSELNRDFHEGKNIEVVKYKENLQEFEAEVLEIELIKDNKDKGIYNKKLHTDLSSKPNIERMKDVKIIGTGSDDNLIKHVCALSTEITKKDFDTLRHYLDMCSLTLYLAQVKGSKPILVLDKNKTSDHEVRHLGCPNWPNCSFAGCGNDS